MKFYVLIIAFFIVACDENNTSQSKMVCGTKNSKENRNPDSAEGEKLFNGYCASCHFPDRDMIGPALKGARYRWIENSTEENFYGAIRNFDSIVATGDEYAIALKEEWISVMIPSPLTNVQIDHIFIYVEGVDPRSGLIEP